MKTKAPHGKDVTVAPHGDGRWSVTRKGNSRASSVHDLKSDAVKIGRKYAKQEHSELVVENSHGRIKSKDSHGHDPRRSKG